MSQKFQKTSLFSVGFQNGIPFSLTEFIKFLFGEHEMEQRAEAAKNKLQKETPYWSRAIFALGLIVPSQSLELNLEKCMNRFQDETQIEVNSETS